MASYNGDSASSSTSEKVTAEQRIEGPWIVEPSLILTAEQLDVEEWTWQDLAREMKDHSALLRFLARRKLIFNDFECEHCNCNAFIETFPCALDQYRWRCPNCAKTWSIRKGSKFVSKPGSLFENVSVFYHLLDWPSASNLAKPSSMTPRLFSDIVSRIISASYEWLHRNLKLGDPYQVFIDAYMFDQGRSIIAVEESTELAVAQKDMSRNVPDFLDKWCAPESTIVFKHSSIHRLSLNNSKYEYRYINVEGRSASSELLVARHRKAIARFVGDLETTKMRLQALPRVRNIREKQEEVDLVVSLKMYFAQYPAKNPFGRFLR
eukprot:scpid72326/ scgid20648/ 